MAHFSEISLVLASNSPRRNALLKRIYPHFITVPSLFSETGGEEAAQTAAACSCGKAREVFSRFPKSVVLGADTVVELCGKTLGKPKDREEAKAMLRALSGREHAVYTGITVVCARGERTEVVRTRVFFYPLGEALIEAYTESGLPLDKAGAYGIQDGYPLVERIEGSYTNVVGLPTEETRSLLREFGGIPC